jgi:glycosyl-4,4'-diaponeurosporenoate acyltransferase
VRIPLITLPMITLGPLAVLVADVVGWALAHSLTGYAAHRMPTARLSADRGILRLRAVERGGRVYEAVRIRRWKDRLPEAGALFPGGVSKRALRSSDAAGRRQFAVETRRAELGHWWCFACAPLFALWNPPVGAVLMVIYGAAANLPCIAVQRYNRGRLARVEGSDAARRHGSNIP